MKPKQIRLSPGASIGRTCDVCDWELHVYYRSRTYHPGEHMPPVSEVPMWWQTVCLCGHRDYEPEQAQAEQLSLLEAV
jgi:hypothetical protein